MVLIVGGRWGDGGDGHADGFQHSRGVASIHGGVFAHLLHDDHCFSDFKSFGLASELMWVVRRRGCGVILRGRGMFSNAVS